MGIALFFIGLVVGGVLGMLAMVLCAAAKQADRAAGNKLRSEKKK